LLNSFNVSVYGGNEMVKGRLRHLLTDRLLYIGHGGGFYTLIDQGARQGWLWHAWEMPAEVFWEMGAGGRGHRFVLQDKRLMDCGSIGCLEVWPDNGYVRSSEGLLGEDFREPWESMKIYVFYPSDKKGFKDARKAIRFKMRDRGALYRGLRLVIPYKHSILVGFSRLSELCKKNGRFLGDAATYQSK
jgi:hypothetical protein